MTTKELLNLGAGLLPVIRLLYKAGIIRVGGGIDNIQCDAEFFREAFSEYQVMDRGLDSAYRYELSCVHEGVLFFALSNDR